MYKYSLIIADDEETIANGLENMVDWHELGFHVEKVFSDGQEVIDYIENRSVDVILSDVVMNNVSGIDVAKYVYENKMDTLVVLLTGYSEFEMAQHAVKYKVDRYLLKPTDMEELISVFKEIKKRKDESRQMQHEAEVLERNWYDAFSVLINVINERLTDKKNGYTKSIFGKADKTDFSGPLLLFELSLKIKDGYRTVNIKKIYGMLCRIIQKQEYSCHITAMITPEKKIIIMAWNKKDSNNEAGKIKKIIDNCMTILRNTLGIGLEITRSFTVRNMENVLDIMIDKENTHNEESHRAIEKSKEYIAGNIQKRISLEDVAEHVYLNPSYLSRLFKQFTGMKFSEYVLAAKIDKAKELLRDNRYYVYQVSDIVGFKDVKYFYKIFKKHVGTTPSRYRNKRCEDA